MLYSCTHNQGVKGLMDFIISFAQDGFLSVLQGIVNEQCQVVQDGTWTTSFIYLSLFRLFVCLFVSMHVCRLIIIGALGDWVIMSYTNPRFT